MTATEPHVGATFCSTLVDEWARRGVRHAVVAPGSRSTPMALALAAHDGVAVHVHTDERAAAFVALGIGTATGVPAVVLTTSGTAAVELHPAVVEAHQAAVPLLAVTADRPPELRGTGAPQTIDQRELFGVAVRGYLEPGPPEWSRQASWRPLAREALELARGSRPGPVQIDLAFAEPLVGPAGALPRPEDDLPPAQGSGRRPTTEQLAALVSLTDRPDGLIVAGARAALDDAGAASILALAEELRWPVLADHLSGCRRDHPSVVTTFDSVLRAPGAALPRPGVVLRLGGLLASRVANEWLAASGAVQLGIDRVGLTPDPDGLLADRLWAAPEELADALHRARRARAGASPSDPSDGSAVWAEAERRARAAIDVGLAAAPSSEPAVAAAVVGSLGDGDELVVASSMPVRDLEWYAPPGRGVRIRANRGANGIDGVVSTALGIALTGPPTVALVGDLAFLHDANALIGLARRPVDLAVVVVDNDGGGIFSFLPQAEALPQERFEQLFGTPHGADLLGLARAHGVDAQVAGDAAAVSAALDRWRQEGGVGVVVVPSDRRANVAHHRALHDAVADALDGLRS